ncbi:hypothetical protein PTSG_01846 [Salpingoeca rosetta]|uniref:Uncharacterized protein n=1 Tax=Salpingoeca rosetta (strain ATCC 50818 / BSB-021) TaxID=946362 RepID=F2TZ45_SALR5|nr:uncharacterized protein PTSG_01846 [Salpingoeca rosetta]EGD78869.1 hypothetical protein PTSG_01846 [Salpingoeca rosetta]|eukprot:XP_004997825.1 hypothetical protein PTSG_01846 [Salpingoeca rosetta]
MTTRGSGRGTGVRKPGAVASGTKRSTTSTAASKTAKSKAGPAKKVSASSRAAASSSSSSSSSTSKVKSTTTAKKAGSTSTTARRGRATATGRKTNVASRTKGTKTAAAKKKKKPELSPEEKQRRDAAIVIQRNMRRVLAQRHAAKLKKDKEEYEKTMEELEREAWLALVKREQEQDRLRMQLEMQKRKEKKERMQREKDMREAAFDGEIDTLLNLFDKFELDIDAADGNGDTPLLEAAGGGHVAAVNLLISRGADVNAQGRFDRTPLYRAAFGGHADVVSVLLEAGGDPRVYDSEGITPAEVASNDEVAAIIKEWDIALTDAKLVQLKEQKHQRLLAEKARKEEETQSLEKVVADAEAAYKAHRNMLTKARMELEKRIREHDEVVQRGDERLAEVTLKTIKDAEAEVARAELKFEAAEIEVRNARLKLREQRLAAAEEEEHDGGGGGDERRAGWLKCSVRELDDVLVRDVGDRIASSGKWPLLVDRSKQVATFLRYRNTNYVNMCSPYDTEKDRLRIALLGSIRYAKPLVLDLMDVDASTLLEDRFNAIQPDLFINLVNKNIMHDFCYSTLIRKEDGEEYELKRFNQARIDEHFKVYVVTQDPYPDDELVSQFFPIQVLPAGASL